MQGEDRSETALTVAPALLARIAWPVSVLTGDRRHLCQQVCGTGGDYLLVKENQPARYPAIAFLFDPPASAPLPLLDRPEVGTSDRNQGPTVMALLRETSLNLLRRHDAGQISARLCYHSQYQAAAVALLLDSPPTRA
jgi:hypothetical protein